MSDIDNKLTEHNPPYCDTCGCTPCCNPAFCAACHTADVALAAEPRATQEPALPDGWNTVPFGTLWKLLNARRSLPQSTRDHGFHVPQATLDAAAWLMFQVGDEARLRRFVNKSGRSLQERVAIMTYLALRREARHGR